MPKSKPLLGLARTAAGLVPGFAGLGARALVEGINAIGGFGDYTVQSNSLTTKGTVGIGVPQFNVANGHRVTHRECVGTLVSNGSGFGILRKLTLNPSDSTTFPWLSTMAKNFIMYEVKGMVVVFESNCSEYASGAALGTVCIGTKYDSREPPFTDMVEMQNSMFAVSAKPSQNIIHPIECARGFQPVDTFYVRRGNEGNTSYNYDKAVTYVCAEGLSAPAGTVIGRLWVSYDLEFKSPAMVPPSVMPGEYETKFMSWAASAAVDPTAIFRSAGTVGTQSNATLVKLVDNFPSGDAPFNEKLFISNTSQFMRVYGSGTYTFTLTYIGTGLPTTATLMAASSPAGLSFALNDLSPAKTATQGTYVYQLIVPADQEFDSSKYVLVALANTTGTPTGQGGTLTVTTT